MSSKKSNKYSLLKKTDNEDLPKKKDKQEEEWIEMDEFENMDKKYLLNEEKESTSYVKLEENTKGSKLSEDSGNIKQANQNQYQKSQMYQQQQQQPQQQPQRQPQQQQYQQYPNQNNNSSNYRPSNQRMPMSTSTYAQHGRANGYQQQQQQYSQFQQPQPNNRSTVQPSPPYQSQAPLSSTSSSQLQTQKKPKIPEMSVNCEKCTFSQSVPGNAQLYICCMCEELNECYPLYGIFECGVCHCKVIYPYGTSEFIKCTRCSTINRVSTEPKKKYKEEEIEIKRSKLALNKEKGKEEASLLLKSKHINESNKVVVENNVNKTSSIPPEEKPFKVLPTKNIEKREENEDIKRFEENQDDDDNFVKPLSAAKNDTALLDQFEESESKEKQKEEGELIRENEKEYISKKDKLPEIDFFDEQREEIKEVDGQKDNEKNEKTDEDDDFFANPSQEPKSTSINQQQQHSNVETSKGKDNHPIEYPSMFDD